MPDSEDASLFFISQLLTNYTVYVSHIYTKENKGGHRMKRK